jgi:hypothetical protein
MSKEDGDETELKQIWSLFQDSPEDIKARRQQVTQALNERSSEFPGTMSIVTSLDELLGCFAVGGQIKNYYRYGTYDLCKRQREKFWFAVKNGTMYDGEKPITELTTKELTQRQVIQEFYKKRLLEDKAKGSSEDIWDVRLELAPNPFKKSL